MTTFHDCFLPSIWKKDLTNKIWQETMAPGIIFIDWIEYLQDHNSLLTSYLKFISDNVFLSNLHAQISKPLQDAICNIPEIQECNNLNVWTKLVMVQDDKLCHKCKELEDMVKATMAACSKHVHVVEATLVTSIQMTSTSAVTSSFYYPPPQCHTNLALPAGLSSNTCTLTDIRAIYTCCK